MLRSRVATEPYEQWLPYVRRVGALVKETGAHVILRPMAFPAERVQCQALLELWHELADMGS